MKKLSVIESYTNYITFNVLSRTNKKNLTILLITYGRVNIKTFRRSKTVEKKMKRRLKPINLILVSEIRAYTIHCIK